MNSVSAFSEPIQSILNARFGANPQIQFLQEEASTRKYFLVRGNREPEVLCLDERINQDFLELSAFFAEKGILAPRVLAVFPEANCFFQTFEGTRDLSSLTQEDYQKKIPEALDLLFQLQALEPPELVQNRAFDLEKLQFEINLTVEMYKIFRQKFSLQTEFSTEVLAFLQESCGYLDKYSVRVMAHRDFHCRNLLLNESDQIVMIDFQDARMGTPQYDLASILYDPYFPLPRQFRIQTLEDFRSRSLGKENRFKECFYLQALQRSFKALGTYFRMVAQAEKIKFKSSILNCLNQLEEIVQIAMFSDALYIFTKELQMELRKSKSFQAL